MRLLWLTPEVPEPGGSGGAIRASHLLRGLAALGAHATVVAPAYAEQAERAGPVADAGVELRLVRRPASRRNEALEQLARHPALAARAAVVPWLGLQGEVFWHEIEPTVRDVVATSSFDGLIVEHEFVAPWAMRVPGDLRAGLALQNAFWTVYGRRAEASAGVRHVLARAEEARFRAFVRAALPRYGIAWAVCEEDRDEVTELAPALPLELVPNGVDVGRFASVPIGADDARTLLFAGTLSYPPNAEAVRWLAEEVLPLVRERRPDVSLRVVGRGASPRLAAAVARAGAELCGWVPDLEPEYRAAAVAVAPIRSGSGTNLKVLEALAAGRPLVATPMALRGIDVREDVDLLVADTAQEFADAVTRLLDDRVLAQHLAASGREHVAARNDWGALAACLHQSIVRWLGL